MNDNRLINYVALLRIREKGARRDMYFAGGLFFVFLAASMLVPILLEDLPERVINLAAALTIAFGVVYSTAFARYQIIKESITLAENLS